MGKESEETSSQDTNNSETIHSGHSEEVRQQCENQEMDEAFCENGLNSGDIEKVKLKGKPLFSIGISNKLHATKADHELKTPPPFPDKTSNKLER